MNDGYQNGAGASVLPSEPEALREMLERQEQKVRRERPPGPGDVPAEQLLAARLEHFGVDMPPAHPMYDRLFIWPLDDMSEDGRFKGTSIIMPSMSKGLYGASRGLLIAAGMKALDQLYSHGCGLGHIVWYARLSPWARKYPGNGRISQVVVLRATEIVGSEDLMAELAGEGLEIGRDEEGTHYIVDKETKQKDRGRTDPEDSIDGS